MLETILKLPPSSVYTLFMSSSSECAKRLRSNKKLKAGAPSKTELASRGGGVNPSYLIPMYRPQSA